MNHGFIKVAAAVPSLKVADCQYNSRQIIALMQEASRQGVEMIAFPALSISACTCGDLFMHSLLQREAMNALSDIMEASRGSKILSIVGMPLAIGQQLYKVAVAVQEGKIVGIVPDADPDYQEQRWFSPGCRFDEIEILDSAVPCAPDLLIQMGEAFIGIMHEHEGAALENRAGDLAAEGANLLVCLSSQADYQGHFRQIKRRYQAQAQSLKAGLIYTSAGMGESSGEHLHGGQSLILEEDQVLAQGKAFQSDNQLIISDINLQTLYTQRLRETAFRKATAGDAIVVEVICENAQASACAQVSENTPAAKLHRQLQALPFIPSTEEAEETFSEIFDIQVCGLAKRMQHIGMPGLVIGISGGLDSTLSLLVAVAACDKLGISREKVLGITMPGFGTSGRTYNNALELMKLLGISTREISIRKACEQHFSDIGHDASQHNIVYENAQARERTQILMDVANQVNGIVVGTGDLSELALGWATYNGDHMSMYGTNASLPKTLIRHLVSWIAGNKVSKEVGKILLDIVDTPVSPELLPTNEDGKIAQKTEDLVGPYELHDFFLYHICRNAIAPEDLLFMAQQAFAGQYDEATIKHWLKTFIRRFFTQQFKRACMPESVQATQVSLSPRGAFSLPSDAVYSAWADDLT